jgi:GNAT superfamily N-acetyltransferase
MIEIKHVDGVNYSGAVKAIHAAYFELMENGLTADELAVGWDNNVIVASENGELVGVMVWAEQKHDKTLWLTLSYVVPARRGQGVFQTMWDAIVEKTKEKGLVQIKSLTHVRNAPMRRAAAKAGRVEEMIQLVYRMPTAESDESYRKRLSLLVGAGSVNSEKIKTAAGSALDELGSAYVGGRRR